jgi:aerobic C4-dicarboxylate transport protein
MAFIRKGHVQVLIALVLAILFGVLAPHAAVQVKPLGDAFIALLRMLLAPLVFCSVVLGLSHVRDMRRLGRLALKALMYFELLTTLGMALAFAVVNLFKPGVGMHAMQMPSSTEYAATSSAASHFTAIGFFLNIIPTTLVDAFAKGEILQVLLVSVLVGTALSTGGADADSVLLKGIAEGQQVLFRILHFLMRLAPLGAFGAMTAAVGNLGFSVLPYLLKLVLLFYATSFAFVTIILGCVATLSGISLWAILKLIREELLLVFGTASGEVALPRLMLKLQQAGCEESIVGFVLPAGYSFNLDGTSLYMAIAVVFIAQATDTPFTLTQQLGVLAVLLLTSKGGTTVAGGAFIKLAATLQTVRALPLSGLGLLFGVDRLMSTCIAVTNVIGNTVAVFVIAKWEGAFDRERFEVYRRALSDGEAPEIGLATASSERIVKEDAGVA